MKKKSRVKNLKSIHFEDILKEKGSEEDVGEDEETLPKKKIL